MAFEYKSGPLSEIDTLDAVCDRGSVTDQVIKAGGFDLDDTKKIRLGTGNDGTIYYDGTNLVIDPKEVGAGVVNFNGGSLSSTGALDFDGLTIGTTSGGAITDIKDEDNMVSDSQTALATQQSVKAYADALTLDNVCDIGSTTDQVIEAGGFTLTTDSDKILLGTGSDAGIYYNGTNLVIDPKEVGTGIVDLNGGAIRAGINSGFGVAPSAEDIVRISGTLSVVGLPTGLRINPTLTSTGTSVYALTVGPTVTIETNKTLAIADFGCPAITVTSGTGSYKGFTSSEPVSLTGVLHTNYGIYLNSFTKGNLNYTIYANLGVASFGDDLELRNDSDKIYFGAAKDAYLEFDGDSLNIVANATTGTDDLNLTADILNLNAGLTFADAKDIAFNTTTGTKIGTATAQKLSFYNATPVDQPVTVADAATQDLTGADSIDKTKLEADLTSCKDAVNAVIDRLQELGLIA